MNNNPFGFLNYPRKDNPITGISERITSFQEFHEQLDKEERLEQASRCMHCGVPFCQSAIQLKGAWTGCPLHNLIPEWNEELCLGHEQYALDRLLKTNPFPEFTSRVCPALCEKACINGVNGKSTTVHDNEFFIIENGFEKGWMTPKIPSSRSDCRVAIIGSGPAGLSAAHLLNQRGHHVTVYERDDRPGGLLQYGIPNMKLDKSIVKRRISLMEEEGVQFQCQVEAGKDISLEELQAQYDAIVFAAGSRRPRSLPLQADHVSGIVYAVDYLKEATRSLLDHHKPSINAKGKHVVIVGGGDTGNDCVATAIRQHAKSVTQLEMMPEPPENRQEDNPWPEWPRVKKTDYGQEEAIAVFGKDPRLFQTTVSSIEEKDGHLQAVTLVSLGQDGKPVEGSERTIPCQLLLIAAGFTGIEDQLREAFQLPVGPRNTILAPEETMTISDGLFACGDCRRGQSLVVWALEEGKRCARAVDKYLMGYTNIE